MSIHPALDCQILRGVVGSTTHGLEIEGQDDRDEMGIFVELPEYVCGLTPVDHYIHRDQPEGVRSQPGDLDLTLYSLRKYCKLAAQGNPSIILLLWLPTYLIKIPLGEELISMRRSFISKESGKRFLGYLLAQKAKLKGERSPKVSRPELVEAYGFDVKFAMHALRLGLQGLELLKTNHLILPIEEPKRTLLREIRTGKWPLEHVLELIEATENQLKTEIDRCEFQVDRGIINKFLVKAHQQYWSESGV